MVKLTFIRAHEPPHDSLCDDAIAAPPHEVVGWHFSHEYRYVTDLARRRDRIIALLEDRGPPIDGDGELYDTRIEKEYTTLTSIHFDHSCTLPTPWFLDALERWLAFRRAQDALRGVRT